MDTIKGRHKGSYEPAVRAQVRLHKNSRKCIRLCAIRNAPANQYPSTRLTGGKNASVMINQPISSRMALLIDSVRTSTKGMSLVRMGFTLYRMPITQSQISHNRVNELRDDAIITLLLSTGIRVSECVGLDLEDVSLDKKTIRIIRKGRTKTQELHINDEANLALFRYITEGRRPSAIDPEALFISKKGQRITVRSVQRLVRKYAKASGTDKKISCHKLRSTYGTNLYEATRDLNAVAERLGHASIETSRTYVRSSSDIDKENASLDIYSEHETGDTIGRPPLSK